MESGRDLRRWFVVGTVIAAFEAFSHAAITWTLEAALVFGAIAIAMAFPAEVVTVRMGWLVHYTKPRVFGVPIVALLGWVATIYVAYRIALVVVAPPLAFVGAAAIATAGDLITDPIAVRRGLWGYPEARVSSPRVAGVPWWDIVGWFVLTAGVSGAFWSFT